MKMQGQAGRKSQDSGAITKFDWTVLPHLPYSPDLVPSDFYLYGALKDAIRRTKFGTDDDVIRAVRS